SYVKGTLFHLIADYRKQRREWPGPLPAEDAALAAAGEAVVADRQFVESWCDQLVARAWGRLAEIDVRTGQHLYAVLRLRAENPQMPSPHMAEQLAARLGRPLTAAGVRQTLHRAREKFADLLLDEVTHSLHYASADQLEEELSELGLLDYCR